MATICILDDDAAIREMMCEVLEDAGYQVVTVETGAAALTVLPDLQPDLLITDLWLWPMDGLAVCRAMQANPAISHVPILLCSGGEEPVISEPRLYTAFLAKPFNLDSFLRLIAQLMQGCESHTASRRGDAP